MELIFGLLYKFIITMMNYIRRRTLYFIIQFLGLFIKPISFLMSFGKRERIPLPTSPHLFKSATKLAEMIRNKEAKSEDIIKTFIERVREVNPIVNAVVETRYEIALSEARDIDQLISSGAHTVEELEAKYPLLGVPITVKESIAVEGMSNAAGRAKQTRRAALKDADCVALARAAGAVPLLVSNTPELCMCWETFNNVTGITKNPYNTSKTVGGSSGGEAALLACGASVIGIGSDIAGSLRIPGFYTGTYGHKPTPRAVSTQGHVPTSNSDQWTNFFTLGPMSRYAEDLPLLLKVLCDPNGVKLQLDKQVDIKEIKFYYIDSDNSGATSKIGSEVKEALNKVIKYFDNTYGIQVQKANFKHMKHAFDVSSVNMLRMKGVESAVNSIGEETTWKNIFLEIIKKIFGYRKTTIYCLLYSVFHKIVNSFSDNVHENVTKYNGLILKEYQNLLKEDSVIFVPTLPITAQRHYEFVRQASDYTYAMIFNSIGLPVTQCPLGLTPRGMPVGVQIVGNKGCDHLTLAVARELEKAFGGWVPATNS